jgi:hypothetical protein
VSAVGFQNRLFFVVDEYLFVLIFKKSVLFSSVPGPWCFDVDPDHWFLCLLRTVGTFTSVFKESKLLRSHKTVEIKIFLIL